MFCIRLHFVRKERIGVEQISAARLLTIDEGARRHGFIGKIFNGGRERTYWIAVVARRRASRRSLCVGLLGKTFEDLDAELFGGRPLDFPQLIPEPDHFALFLDGHESPPT
ncbi:hypothetical protein ABIF65_003258 [Bradyrhizobium japonicum]|uniref:hypothetical protein n=1 Tax=Bradyrhizobium TaxID=374 RepID=UPI0012BC47FA|nr:MULTISPECIES: hypothetical protein [Bradyrhizobium]MBR0883329.1 hypothetical protein [Bradyrhizobium liaoningense]MBR1000986.1 hypothetical protein [Bradyrhizobium liaoningense]MBR1070646.1 hypothetical protein [Bradyrhizobium liaoningense]MCP1741288.1 hypothetical protein [Bradyrhizobium japonicum]MCP1779944.1 hypothetical protein [Bradyrhizobium japonicum]